MACAHVADANGNGNGNGNGYFGMFSVDPNHQGNGIGKLVLAEAEAYAAREWGVRAMQMTVIDVRDELIAFTNDAAMRARASRSLSLTAKNGSGFRSATTSSSKF